MRSVSVCNVNFRPPGGGKKQWIFQEPKSGTEKCVLIRYRRYRLYGNRCHSGTGFRYPSLCVVVVVGVVLTAFLLLQIRWEGTATRWWSPASAPPTPTSRRPWTQCAMPTARGRSRTSPSSTWTPGRPRWSIWNRRWRACKTYTVFVMWSFSPKAIDSFVLFLFLSYTMNSLLKCD